MANQANIRAVITAEDRASSTLKGFGRSVDRLGASLIAIAKKSAIALGVAAGAATALGVKTAADLETARSAFIGLLGSAEEADKTLTRIKREAKATPFEMTGLVEGTKQLSAVTKTGDEAIDILLNVGKAITASGGGQVELDRVVYNLKQIKGMGELSAIDLKELRRAIPIFDKLVEAAGTTVKEIQKSKDPAKALFDVFEKGGTKIEAVDKAFTNQAGNFNQLVSNMKDSFAIFTSDMVNRLGIFQATKDAIKGVTDVLTGSNESVKGYGATFTRVISQVASIVNDLFMPTLRAVFNTFKNNVLPQLIKLNDALSPGFYKAIVIVAKAIGALFVAQMWVLINVSNILWKTIGFGINVITRLIKYIGNIGGVAINAGKALVSGFKVAFNQVANMWNSTVGSLSFQVPDWVPKLGGKGWEVPDIPTFATGTDYAPGGMALVGEKGPELVNLPRGSRVIPNHRTEKMGGASTINITVQAGAFMGSKQDARRYAMMIKDALKDVATMQGRQPGEVFSL